MLGESGENAAGAVRRVPTWSYFSFFLLTADSETSQGMRWDVARHVVHVMYEEKSISSRPLKYSLLSVSDAVQPLQIPRILLYAARFKNNSCIFATFSLWKTRKRAFCQLTLQHSAEDLHLLMNRASLELRPPKLKTDTSDQKERLVGIATGHGLDDRGVGVRVPVGINNFNFSISSKPALESTQPPIQWVPGALSPVVKWPEHEADRSPPTSAEVKKIWIYTSPPPYAFMA
jgi:hypothetical protein